MKQKHLALFKHFCGIFVENDLCFFFKEKMKIFFYEKTKACSPNSGNNFKCYHNTVKWRIANGGTAVGSHVCLVTSALELLCVKNAYLE